MQKLSAGGAEIWTRVLWDHNGRDDDHGVGIDARGNTLVVAAFLTGHWVEWPGKDVGHAWLGGSPSTAACAGAGRGGLTRAMPRSPSR